MRRLSGALGWRGSSPSALRAAYAGAARARTSRRRSGSRAGAPDGDRLGRLWDYSSVPPDGVDLGPGSAQPMQTAAARDELSACPSRPRGQSGLAQIEQAPADAPLSLARERRRAAVALELAAPIRPIRLSQNRNFGAPWLPLCHRAQVSVRPPPLLDWLWERALVDVNRLCSRFRWAIRTKRLHRRSR